LFIILEYDKQNTVTLIKGNAMQVTVQYGASTINRDLNGPAMSINGLRALVSEILGIPRDAVAYANGAKVNDSYPLRDNDSIVFQKTTGEKG